MWNAEQWLAGDGAPFHGVIELFPEGTRGNFQESPVAHPDNPK